MASIMMLSNELDFFDKDNIPDRTIGLLLVCFVLFQIGMEVHYRLTYTFNDGLTASHSEVLSYGPQKGVRTSLTEADRYYLIMEDTEAVRNFNAENVMYLSADSWLYLADTKKSSSYSSWISPQYPENSVDKLLEYWRIHPERKPDIIYIDKYYPNSAESLERLNVNNREYIEAQRGYIVYNKEVMK